MRVVPTQADTKKATEPLILMRVDWESGTQYYGDKEVDIGSETYEGKILEFSPISNQITENLAGEVINASVLLDDTDGALKSIIDTDVIESTSVTVYQYFEGMDEADILVLMRGKIYGSVTWSEGERTLAFEIQTYTFDGEIGYKPDAEDIAYYGWDEDIEGAAWPMIFGIPEKVEAIKLYGTVYVTNTSIITPDLDGAREVVFSLDDYGSLPDGNFYLTVYPNERKTWGVHATAPMKFYGYVDKNTGLFYPQSWTNPLTSNVVVGDNIPVYQEVEIASRPSGLDSATQNNKRIVWLESEYIDLRGQLVLYRRNYSYPDAPPPDFQVNRCVVQHGKFCIFEKEFNFLLGDTLAAGTTEQFLEVAPTPRFEWKDEWGTDVEGTDLDLYYLEDYIDVPSANWNLVDYSFTPNTYYYEKGCKTQVMVGDTITYVCDTIGGGTLEAAYYEKQVEGRKYLAEMESDIFTFTSEGNLGPYTGISYLEIDNSFTIEQIDKDATGRIFVTIDNSEHRRYVGNVEYIYDFQNPSGVIQYLIDVYADTGIDRDSMYKAGQYLENYECNFKLNGGAPLIQTLKEIAWQARCALSIRNGTFFLKYLSTLPEDSYSLEPQTIEFKSMSLGFKDSTSIITVIESEFYEDWYGAPSKFIYRNNEDQYGMIKEEIPCYIYKDRSYVEYTIGFWGYRMSESWRKITLNSFLNALRLEAFDTTALSLDTLSANTINGLVESLAYDSDAKKVNVAIELASKSGDTDSDSEPVEDEYYWLGDPRYQIPDISIDPEAVPDVTYLTLAFLSPVKFETAYYKGSNVIQYLGTQIWNSDYDDYAEIYQSLVEHYTSEYVSYATAIIAGGLLYPEAGYGAYVWEYEFWRTLVAGIPVDEIPGIGYPEYDYTRYIGVDPDCLLADLQDAFIKAGGNLTKTQKVKIFQGNELASDGFFQSGTAYDEFTDWLTANSITVEETGLGLECQWLESIKDYYDSDIPTP